MHSFTATFLLLLPNVAICPQLALRVVGLQLGLLLHDLLGDPEDALVDVEPLFGAHLEPLDLVGL